jgi:hypothetical protein
MPGDGFVRVTRICCRGPASGKYAKCAVSSVVYKATTEGQTEGEFAGGMLFTGFGVLTMTSGHDEFVRLQACSERCAC